MMSYKRLITALVFATNEKCMEWHCLTIYDENTETSLTAKKKFHYNICLLRELERLSANLFGEEFTENLGLDLKITIIQ